jgi:hypothetical protein
VGPSSGHKELPITRLERGELTDGRTINYPVGLTRKASFAGIKECGKVRIVDLHPVSGEINVYNLVVWSGIKIIIMTVFWDKVVQIFPNKLEKIWPNFDNCTK